MHITKTRGALATGVLGFALAGAGVLSAAAPALAAPPARPGHHGAGPGWMWRCHTGDLVAGLRMLNPSAGGRHAVLTLRNTGRTACVIRGHAGLRLYDRLGRALPTRSVWTGGPGDRVTLWPGRGAFTRLDWSVVPGDGEPVYGRCEPTPAWLTVTPPAESTHRTVTWPYGPVCEHGEITSGPLSPGTGPVD